MELFNRLVVGTMPMIPKYLVGRIASRYIAGEEMEDALEEVKSLNEAGALGTIDLLGEFSEKQEDAEKSASVYYELLDKIEEWGINANISLKPSALGLKIGYDLCKSHIERIVGHAAKKRNFVRLDMEDHTCTDDTLRMYYELHEKYSNVGVVIQSYLRRTVRDVKKLKSVNANLRICKGIYNEPRMIAYKDRQIIINNYAMLLQELLEAGCYVGIATHCEETVWHALRIIQKLGLKRDQYEFQMLLGVDPELRKIITNEGHKMRVYVPYGKEWYPYSTRRLIENPQLAGSVAKEFLGL